MIRDSLSVVAVVCFDECWGSRGAERGDDGRVEQAALVGGRHRALAQPRQRRHLERAALNKQVRKL
jgi:hypothetical protein